MTGHEVTRASGGVRPLRRRLPDEAVELIDAQRAAGETPPDVHLMLVLDDGKGVERGQVACGHGLGEWVTGDGNQVTCSECLAMVHS